MQSNTTNFFKTSLGNYFDEIFYPSDEGNENIKSLQAPNICDSVPKYYEEKEILNGFSNEHIISKKKKSKKLLSQKFNEKRFNYDRSETNNKARKQNERQSFSPLYIKGKTRIKNLNEKKSLKSNRKTQSPRLGMLYNRFKGKFGNKHIAQNNKHTDKRMIVSVSPKIESKVEIFIVKRRLSKNLDINCQEKEVTSPKFVKTPVVSIPGFDRMTNPSLSPKARLLWISFFVICLMVCCYQTNNCLLRYFKGKPAVSITLTRPYNIPIPSFSICPNNIFAKGTEATTNLKKRYCAVVSDPRCQDNFKLQNMSVLETFHPPQITMDDIWNSYNFSADDLKVELTVRFTYFTAN